MVHRHSFTVMSDGSLGADVRQIPREVHMAGGQTDPLASQPSNGKRVKIFVVPSNSLAKERPFALRKTVPQPITTLPRKK
jgi:hypothetical protein